MLYGGVVADRVSRRTLLVVTQSLSMLLAFVLAALTFLRVVAPWHIVVLAFCLGVVNAFDAPARQSFVLEMVDRHVLTNAIALNSTMFNVAISIGPAIGGLTYAWFGPAWCFTINGLSFVAVIAALASMKLAPKGPPAVRRPAIAEVREGLAAVGRDRRILGLILLMGALSLFGMWFAVLIPAWAVQVLGGDARTNGFLQSARGIGALAAALVIASVAHRRVKGRLISMASFAFPVALLLFSFTRTLPLSLLLLLAVGWANIFVNNLANALVQGLVADEVRGRVMGIYMLAFFGFMPLGALLAGSVAEALGAPLAIAISAGCFFACAGAMRLAAPAIRRLG
jgi:predicted MFS family arabinose efflux permease